MGGGNIKNNLIISKDRIVIPLILKSCVLNWYHTYLLRPVTDRTYTMIRKHMYFPGNRKAIQKEVNNFDTFQRIKRSNKIWYITR